MWSGKGSLTGIAEMVKFKGFRLYGAKKGKKRAAY